MEDLYKMLGFKYPDFIENPYGIKIYVGTKGKEDWCIEIPEELVRIKCTNSKYCKNYVVYCVSEEEVLRLAKEYTDLAKERRE